MIRGAYTALVTPFKNGKVNYEKLGELIEFQISNEIDGIVICGTTGESSSLTDKEKKKVIKYTVETVNGRVPVIAGTGSNDTRHSIELSKYAERVGADGLLIVTPYYNKTSQKGLIEHYTAIADSVTIPLIIYNVPSRTGLNILPDTVAKLAEHENIIGIKEASNNFSQILELISKVPSSFSVVSGNDDTIVPLLSLGGTGVISVLSNIYPFEMRAITDAALDGDYIAAAEMQRKLQSLSDLMFSEVNPIPVKEAMRQIGYDCGPCRLPLCKPTQNTEEAITSYFSR